MKDQSTKRIRTGLLTAALAGGTLFGASQLGGIANAQTDETPTTETPADDTTLPTETPTDDGETHDDRRSGDRSAKSEELADLLGIEAAELREQLADGATLAEIAEANGVDVQTVIDAIVEQMSERLDHAVENGRLDAAEADDKLAELEERATIAVNEGGPILRGRDGGRGGEHRSGACEDASGEDGETGGDAASEDTSEESLVLVES